MKLPFKRVPLETHRSQALDVARANDHKENWGRQCDRKHRKHLIDQPGLDYLCSRFMQKK